MTTNTGEGGAMETAEDNGYFVVEKILDEKWDEVEKQLYYKIRWSGYDSDQDTLEPATQLAHCADILAEWEATKKARETQEGSTVTD
jgi:ectoine hydroxylase-related dioxygenase (phytanoyl-CoA dioxygenase family)